MMSSLKTGEIALSIYVCMCIRVFRGVGGLCVCVSVCICVYMCICVSVCVCVHTCVSLAVLHACARAYVISERHGCLL